MVAAKETAEEQLLRMIEGPQGAQTLPPPPPRGSLVKRITATVQGFVTQLWRRVVPKRREADLVLANLRRASRVLWVFLAAVGAYVLIDLLLFQPKPRVIRPTVSTTDGATVSTAAPETQLRPLADYMAAVEQRNPFTGSASLFQPLIKTARHRLEELASSLIVVGIDRGPQPEAIIEDTTQQRTHFVKVGDEINGLLIKEISPKGVIVGYEGEELLLQ